MHWLHKTIYLQFVLLGKHPPTPTLRTIRLQQSYNKYLLWVTFIKEQNC